MIGLSSCEDDDEDKGWTNAQRNDFISECSDPIDGDGTAAQCECLFDGISTKFSPNELENLENDIAAALEVLTIATDCGIEIDLTSE